MYCHNCGKKALGNFCQNCGTKLIRDEPDVTTSKGHWSEETNYSALVHYPEVRKLISESANAAKKKLSAEDFLNLVDSVFQPIPGISLNKLGDLILPISKKLGIKTGKSVQTVFALSTSKVIVKALCSLAKNGFPLKETQPASNGLILIAEIPSDLWTWGGDIVLAVEALDKETRISIDVKISGQMYDWGKSKGVIKKMLKDIESIRL